MSSEMVKSGKQIARKLHLLQLATIAVLGIVFILFFDTTATISVMLGGTICLCANVVFSWFAFRFSGATKNKEVIKSFTSGLKVKLLMAVIFLALAFQSPVLNQSDLLLGYCVLLLMQYPILIILHRVHIKTR